MKNILLTSDTMTSIALFLIFGSPIAFIIGLCLVAASKETRKAGIMMIIGSVIAFIIGFGTCVANF